MFYYVLLFLAIQRHTSSHMCLHPAMHNAVPLAACIPWSLIKTLPVITYKWFQHSCPSSHSICMCEMYINSQYPKNTQHKKKSNIKYSPFIVIPLVMERLMIHQPSHVLIWVYQGWFQTNFPKTNGIQIFLKQMEYKLT